MLRDAAGDIQLFLEEDTLGAETFEGLDDLDLGDWLGAEGEVIRTSAASSPCGPRGSRC